MYEETLYLKTKNTLSKIQDEKILEDFYLAGGTALALQLGHRKSIDLDFFSKDYPKQDVLLQSLSKYNPTIAQNSIGTLDTFIDDVKVSFFNYSYSLLKDTVTFNNVELASIIDIACMKLVAISQRGTKKDFVDLYVILQKYKFDEILEAFERKYDSMNYQKLHILKSLVYFEDAEADPEPDYLTPIKWDEVKEYLSTLVS